MIFAAVILTLFSAAAVYPINFCFPLQINSYEKYRKLNIALPNCVGGLILIVVWVTSMPLELKLLVTLWKAILLSVSSYSWKKERVSPRLMCVPVIAGVYVSYRLFLYFM